jgi:hypothetical protein
MNPDETSNPKTVNQRVSGSSPEGGASKSKGYELRDL